MYVIIKTPIEIEEDERVWTNVAHRLPLLNIWLDDYSNWIHKGFNSTTSGAWIELRGAETANSKICAFTRFRGGSMASSESASLTTQG
jgi:hypothetical protein